MSVSGISASSLFDYNTQNVQNKMQQIRQEFQQLGQDLQSGNLSAAQSDFATLQQLQPQTSSTSPTQSNPITQEFSQLATDLKSGNVSAAQQDYSTIQQDVQSHAAQGHHHHHGSGGRGESEIGQSISQLGQALQSGNLSNARQVYGSLLQDFQQTNGLFPTLASSSSGSNALSVTA